MSYSSPDSGANPFLTAPNTPLREHEVLEPPRAPHLSPGISGLSSPRDSTAATQSVDHSAALLTQTEKSEEQLGDFRRKIPLLRRPLFWLASFVALAVVVLAVVLPVYFTVVKPRQNTKGSSNNPGGTGVPGNPNAAPPTAPGGATTGGNGSLITTSDGTTFTYINAFGGYWIYDPNDPFNNGARPNSWTPALNETWTWGQDRMNGVNLGGLFVLEPFITPAIFQQYPGAVDEWTLSTLMAADTANGGLNQLVAHYNTFITEQDIAEIAGAGMNWIRLPIPFWAIDKWDFEPFLEKACWPYILRVLQWARKYGLRVNLDLHTIPGSQNGYNHSGKLGSINFLNGVMGLANAERTLNYIRIITEFISQPEWQSVVPAFSIVNEALVSTIGQDEITTFYLKAYDIIRSITGEGAGKGPYIAIHDGFLGLSNWAGFLTGSDRVMLDIHQYFAFDGQSNTEPIAIGTGIGAGGIWPQQACAAWGPGMNTSQTAFGVSFAGEFSNGFNACGLYLTGVGNTDSSTGACTEYMDASQWNATMKAGLEAFALASMDALQNYFFWTWKIGNSSTTNSVQSPLWSYKLGLENGWIPTDPRAAVGRCAALGAAGSPFDGTYVPYQTGGAGAGTISPASISSYGQYPPATISGLTIGAVVSLLPTYTSTGTVATLPPPTFSPTPSVSIGDGWYDSADTGAGPTQVQGCTYPNAWDAVSSSVPTARCPSAGVATPTVTPAPTSTTAVLR